MEVGIKIGKPFQYLDSFMPNDIDWEDICNDTARGLAKAQWIKTAVSAGVHPEWAELEMATYYKDVQNRLTSKQMAIWRTLPTMEQKIKFLTLTTGTVHPFWLCFLRVNKAVEKSQHENKAIAEQCENTANIVFFPKLMTLIKKLPMKSIGRILIFMTEANNQTVPHFDAGDQDQRERMGNADFVWFQPQAALSSGVKKIFVMDEDKNRYYPEDGKKFVWFNEMDYHGTEPSPVFGYSVRVEGKFNDLVRPAS